MHMHLLETHFLACWSHWNEITYGSDLSFTIKKFDSIQIFTLSSMKLKQIPQLERTHILTVRVKFMVWHLAMIFRRIVSVYFVNIIIIIILLIMFFFMSHYPPPSEKAENAETIYTRKRTRFYIELLVIAKKVQ